MKGLEDEPRRGRDLEEEKKERKVMRGGRKLRRNRRAMLAWQRMRADNPEALEAMLSAARGSGRKTRLPVWDDLIPQELRDAFTRLEELDESRIRMRRLAEGLDKELEQERAREKLV